MWSVEDKGSLDLTLYLPGSRFSCRKGPSPSTVNRKESEALSCRAVGRSPWTCFSQSTLWRHGQWKSLSFKGKSCAQRETLRWPRTPGRFGFSYWKILKKFKGTSSAFKFQQRAVDLLDKAQSVVLAVQGEPASWFRYSRCYLQAINILVITSEIDTEFFEVFWVFLIHPKEKCLCTKQNFHISIKITFSEASGMCHFFSFFQFLFFQRAML